MLDSWLHRGREVRMYAVEAQGPGDLARLLRVRLSQSKLGPVTTPSRIVVDVSLKHLGRVRLRSHTSDISVLSELLLGDEIAYLPEMPDAKTVIDLGANIGLSYRWLRFRYPGARFVCVEPAEDNLEILKANAAEDCVVICACIGGRERTVELVGGDGEWGYRMRDSDSGTTPVITMDQLLRDVGAERIDILKCDIEGAERELFSECRSWIGRVRAMVVECHHPTITADELLDLLDANDSHLRVISLQRRPQLGFDLVTLQGPVADCGSVENAR